jgi:hypothetical protein
MRLREHASCADMPNKAASVSEVFPGAARECADFHRDRRKVSSPTAGKQTASDTPDHLRRRHRGSGCVFSAARANVHYGQQTTTSDWPPLDDHTAQAFRRPAGRRRWWSKDPVFQRSGGPGKAATSAVYRRPGPSTGRPCVALRAAGPLAIDNQLRLRTGGNTGGNRPRHQRSSRRRRQAPSRHHRLDRLNKRPMRCRHQTADVYDATRSDPMHGTALHVR